MSSKPANYEVLRAVGTVKALYKSALTRTERSYRWNVDAAFKHFGPTDVEQAARNNTIRRAEVAYGAALEKARMNFRTRLADIKARAGEWVDLVPEASALEGG